MKEPSVDPTRTSPATNPWERFGWIMGGVWIVFLGFPIAALVELDAPNSIRIVGIGIVVLFGAGYLVTLIKAKSSRRAAIGLLVLAALALLLIPIRGAAAVALSPFLISLAGFTLRGPPAIAAVAAVFAGSLWVAVAHQMLAQSAFIFGIMAIVAIMAAVVQLVDRAATAYSQQHRQLELVSERERVARDVHDVLGHSLTVIAVKTELARRLIDLDPERSKTELDDVLQLARTGLGEVRATVAGLRVARLDDEIASATASLTTAGVRAEVIGDMSEVDPRYRLVLAWVVREAVTNVIRHAQARSCRITLGSSSIEVADDGRGAPELETGSGLRGLRERVAAAGGTLRVESGSEGTRVEVQL